MAVPVQQNLNGPPAASTHRQSNEAGSCCGVIFVIFAIILGLGMVYSFVTRDFDGAAVVGITVLMAGGLAYWLFKPSGPQGPIPPPNFDQ